MGNVIDPTGLKTYSFRAECIADVEGLKVSLAKRSGARVELKVIPFIGEADVHVEMKSDLSLREMRNSIRKVMDGHVMLQTLRPIPLEANSLERDYDLW